VVHKPRPPLPTRNGRPSRPDQHVDGVSLGPRFADGSLQRDTLYWHFPHCQGEGYCPASAIRKGSFKLIHNYHHDDLLLFDLATAPNETSKLAPSMPKKAITLDKELIAYLKASDAYLPQLP
jgi:arylsulfatase A-like enzyme